jgi:hypothetical protein
LRIIFQEIPPIPITSHGPFIAAERHAQALRDHHADLPAAGSPSCPEATEGGRAAIVDAGRGQWLLVEEVGGGVESRNIQRTRRLAHAFKVEAAAVTADRVGVVVAFLPSIVGIPG